MPPIETRELLSEAAAPLGLKLIAGAAGLSRPISIPRIQKAGLVLAGHTAGVHPERVQVLGGSEVAYLDSLEGPKREGAIQRLFGLEVAAIVVTRGLAPPSSMIEAADALEVPLLSTPLKTSALINALHGFLDDRLSPSTLVHGVLLDVFGVGILLLGKSGIGKSETALDLVLRGHRLVADDVVEVHLKPIETIVGQITETIGHHMEIRGLGIINIKDLFGIAAVRERKKIELVARLVEWDADDPYDRLGVEDRYFEIFDVRIPMLTIPVRPGRNLSSLVEVAARNQLLKLQGHHSARDFQRRIESRIAAAEPSSHADAPAAAKGPVSSNPPAPNPAGPRIGEEVE